jgi:hypothetical protein
MANLDLDIDFNGMDNDILENSKGSRVDIYPRVVRYASKNGVAKRQVDNIMLEVAGNYSNATDEQISQMAEKFCENEYEKCLKKVKDGTFGDCGDKLQPCKKKFIEDFKKKELRKSQSGSFWNKVVTGVNKLGSATKSYTTTKTGENLGEVTDDEFKNDEPLTETRILGMKPLVFTLVALGTVTTLAIVTVLLMKKGK